MGERVPLCKASELADGGLAMPFDVVHGGQTCRAFAVRHEGIARAFLNRCTHVAMEMDMVPNRFFDQTGNWLICSTHGAVYNPVNGACAGGPCRGGLVQIQITEHEGIVHWHTDFNLKPMDF